MSAGPINVFGDDLGFDRVAQVLSANKESTRDLSITDEPVSEANEREKPKESLAQERRWPDIK